MIICTPRRRISPRTKRKYKAIKNFLRQVLGTSSQGNYTKSSIEVSVSDIKSKIDGIEQQLHTVSKHCRDISSLERKVHRQTTDPSVCNNLDVKSIGENSKSDRNVKNVETKVLYKNSDRQCHRTDESESTIADQSHGTENMTSRPFNQNVYNFESKLKRKHSENDQYEFRRHQRKTKSKHETIPVYSTSSFHSLVAPKHKQYAEPDCSGYHHQRGGFGKEDTGPNLNRNRKIVKQDCWNKNKKCEERRKEKRNKRVNSEVDQDFIEKIIKKQYRPVTVFGRRDSDFSQSTAPVCRDHEFIIKAKNQDGSELCSCCFDGNKKRRHRYIRNNDLSDMRSVCDTRLYSSKKHHRYIYSKRHVDDYNNSAYYDVVPVKEKSSPLSRRKFIEDNAMTYQYSKEVPPSPRTRRPRLNLKAQNYAEYGDSFIHKKYRRRVSPIGYHNYEAGLASDLTFRQRSHENLGKNKIPEYTPPQENIGTMNSFQSPNLNDEQMNQTLNTEITNVSVDKTDKALNEIKDILQSFLIEIKKESIHSDKSNIMSKLGGKSFNESQESDKINATIIPNSGHNFGTHTGQCSMTPFLPSFPNPCYPIIPVCPINCLQNGYILPSSSFTCSDCAKNSKENTNAENEKPHNSETNDKMNTCNETQELIKEIYKYVSQNPTTPRKTDNNENNTNNNSKNDNSRLDKIILTNRSVGGCSKASKHDANVGTPYMRCYSKSCEAIGSRMNSDTYYSTNASYSDTILEKLSLQASQSSTDSDVSTDVSRKKVHRNKFQKLLHSLRLFKRKKKDVIEEVTESESTIVENAKHKAKPPFKQHITNYAMHGQEYFRPPPIPGTFCPPHPKEHCVYDHSCPHQQLPPEIYNHCKHPINQFGMPCDYRMPPKCNPIAHPPCPNYDLYNQIPPQVPLCLKEVEVKSIGTQSQKKMSMFSKFTKKVQPLQQVTNQQQAAPPPNKPTFWKSLQEKAKQQNPDPIDFSLKAQKQLAQEDMKLRNAMLKKLFYKRNPFSPRNLIVRTLLGKDKSSYGNPPKMYRPKMFI